MKFCNLEPILISNGLPENVSTLENEKQIKQQTIHHPQAESRMRQRIFLILFLGGKKRNNIIPGFSCVFILSKYKNKAVQQIKDFLFSGIRPIIKNVLRPFLLSLLYIREM